MIGKVYLAVSGGKIGVVVPGFAAGISSFTFTDFVTGRFWVAVIVSGLCSVFVAFLRTRPQVISASSDATERILERVDRHHHEQIMFLHERALEQTKLISLVTITKHGLITENNSLGVHLRLRGELLRQAGIKFPEVTPKDFSEISEAEDRARAMIAGLPFPA